MESEKKKQKVGEGSSSDMTSFPEQRSVLDKLLLCVSSDLGQLELEDVTKFFDLVASLLCKEPAGVKARKLQAVLKLPLDCLEAALLEMENGVQVGEKVFHAVEALRVTCKGILGKEDSIIRHMSLTCIPIMCKYRGYLDKLDEGHEFANIARFAIDNIFDIFEDIVCNGGDVVFTGDILPMLSVLTGEYRPKVDGDLLQLLSVVVKQNEGILKDNFSSFQLVIKPSIEFAKENRKNLKFCSALARLVDAFLGDEHLDFILHTLVARDLLLGTFWMSRVENVDVHVMTDVLKTLVRVFDKIEVLNLRPPYALDLLNEAFCGFSPKQSNEMFNLCVHIANSALLVAQKIGPEDSVKSKIEKAFIDMSYVVDKTEAQGASAQILGFQGDEKDLGVYMKGFMKNDDTLRSLIS